MRTCMARARADMCVGVGVGMGRGQCACLGEVELLVLASARRQRLGRHEQADEAVEYTDGGGDVEGHAVAVLGGEQPGDGKPEHKRPRDR